MSETQEEVIKNLYWKYYSSTDVRGGTLDEHIQCICSALGVDADSLSALDENLLKALLEPYFISGNAAQSRKGGWYLLSDDVVCRETVLQRKASFEKEQARFRPGK